MARNIDESTIPELPNNVELSYLAEGAANIVYRISFPPSTPNASVLEEYSPSTPPPTEILVPSESPSPIFSNVLLRLRKALPSSQPNIISSEHLHHAIFPLLPPNLTVSHTLVRLPLHLINQENSLLRSLEVCDKRNASRRGLYLTTDEPYGSLITDMTASHGQALVEFKSKWLLQSPSAPEGWTRCRTCALRLQRASKSLHPTKWCGMCPLDLVSNNPQRIANAVNYIAPGASAVDKHRIASFILNADFLHCLRSLQARFDSLGPFQADITSTDFLTAMTLRDCHIFLRISHPTGDGDSGIEERIGDLDMKSAEEGKGEYWKRLEQGLIHEGWYTGTEEGDWEWKKQGEEVNCRTDDM